MLARHRFLTLLTIMIVFGLFVVACERPLSSNDEDSTPVSNGDPELVTSEAIDASETSSEATDSESVDADSEAQEEPPDQPQDESPRPEDAAPDEEPTESETESGETGEESEESSATEESDESEELETPGENEVEEAAVDASEESTSEEAADEGTATEDATTEEGAPEGTETEEAAMAEAATDATPMDEPETVESTGEEAPADDLSMEPVKQTPATHVVASGENLFRIGLSYGMSWIPIAEANGIVNPNQIYAGQVLKIPASVPGPKPEFTHVVQRGETLSQIALRYGVPVQSIVAANNISSPNVIYAGQTLVIPGV